MRRGPRAHRSSCPHANDAADQRTAARDIADSEFGKCIRGKGPSRGVETLRWPLQTLVRLRAPARRARLTPRPPAGYDLTARVSPFMDPHFMFSLLSHARSLKARRAPLPPLARGARVGHASPPPPPPPAARPQVYKERDVVAAMYELALQTRMHKFALESHAELHAGAPLPPLLLAAQVRAAPACDSIDLT